MRIRGYDEETEEYIGGIEDLSGEIADLTKTAKTPGGISLFTNADKTEYKSTYQILKDISDIYDDLTDKQQANLLEKLAGKRQGQVIAAILNNFEAVENSLVTMSDENSAGNAMKEMETIAESLDYKLNALKETAVGVFQNLFQSESMGLVIEGFTKIVELLDFLTEKLGLFGTVLATISIVGFVKNFESLVTAGLKSATSYDLVATSIKKMSTESAIAAITSSSLTDAQKVQLLNSLKLSKAEVQAAMSTARHSASNVAATTTTGALTGATTRLGVALKGLLATIAANPFLILITAATALFGAFSKVKEKEEELRRSAIESGDAARDEAKSISDLYNKYREISSAYESGTATKDQFTEATDNLLSSLGIEQTELDELIKKYGSLEEAIKHATNESLNKHVSDMLSGYKAAKDDFVDDANGWQVTSFGTSSATKVYGDTLAAAGFDNRFERRTGARTFNIPDASTFEGAIEAYETLEKMKLTLEKNAGTSYTNEELLASDSYKKLTDKLSTMKDSYEKAKEYVTDINSTLAQIEYNNYVDKNGVPQTVEEYKKLKESIVDTSKENGKFVGTQEQINDSITNTLSRIPELTDYVNEISKQEEMASKTWKILEKFYNTKYYKDTEDWQLQESKATSFNMWLNSLTDEQKEIVYQITLDTDVAEFTLQDWKDKLAESSHKSATSLKEIQISSATATKSTSDLISNLSSVQDFLSSQSTGESLSIEDFNSEELKDYISALEYHNGTMQLSTEKVNELIEAKSKEQIEINNSNKALAQSKYLENAAEIEKLRKKIKDNSFATNENAQSVQANIDALLAENETIKATCDGYDVMTTSLQEATDAYHNWLNAQNSAQSGDMFDDTLDAINRITDTLNNTDSEFFGRIGRTDYQAAIKLIIPDSIDEEDKAKVNAYLDSIYQMFTYDEDGNYSGLNIANFCQKAVDEGLMVLDESGKNYEIAGSKTMEDFANGMELSLPLVQAMFGEMEEFGGKFSWADEANKTIGDLAVSANVAAEKLRALHSDITITLDTSDLTTTEEKVTSLDSTITQMQTYLDLGVDSSEYEYAYSIISYCVTQKQQLADPVVLDIDISKVSEQTGEAISLLQEFKTNYNDLQLKQALKLDTTEAQAKVDELYSKISTSENDSLIALSLDTSSIDNLNTSIDALEQDNVKLTLQLDDEAFKSFQPEDREATVTYNVDSTAVDNFNPKNLTRTVTYYTKTIGNVGLNGFHQLNGSANVSGTALANGDWRTTTGGNTLVGELGQEIVVNPKTGRWYTVGDNGAQFTNIPKGAIVFNHKQTESLLKYGHVASRASAMISGSALLSGNAMVTGGISVNSATDSSKSGGNSTSNYQSTNKGSNNSKTDEEKFDTIDWIEVAIDRAERGIKKLSTIASSAYKDFSTRNKALKSEISAITDEIGLQQQAYTAYMQKANSIGLSSDLMYKVQNGTIDITEYNSDVADQIKEYQQWYEAALDCEQAILDLSESISDLYKEKFDNTVKKWTNKVQDLEHIASRADSLITRRNDLYNEYMSMDNSKGKNEANIEDYRGLIDNAQSQIAIKQSSVNSLIAELNAGINSGSIEHGSEAFYDMLNSIQEVEREIDELSGNIITYANGISEAYQNIFDDTAEEYDYKLSELEHLSNQYNHLIEKANAQGYVATASYYEMLKEVQSDTLNVLKSEQKDLSDALYSAVASGEIEVGSQAWYEMSQEICNVTERINEAELAVIDLNNQIRQTKWDNFDLMQERISWLTDESNFLIDVMSNKQLYTDKGQLTNEGMATMGLHGLNYNTLMSQADDYAKEIISINNEIAKDPSNLDLINRRKELLDLQYQSITAAESEKNAIKDLVSNGIDKELSSLKELISEYTEALDSQKNLYDYQKKVQEQTKNIATLRKELSAYENDMSEETRAKVQKLQVELEDAEDNLRETQYDKYVADQKELLDNLYLEYETALNARLDNIDALIETQINTINANAIEVNSAINNAALSVGYSLSTEMSTLWGNAATTLADMRADRVNEVTQMVNQMMSNGILSVENANAILDALGNGSELEAQNALNIIAKLQETGELDTTNAVALQNQILNSQNALNTTLNNNELRQETALATYGTDFSSKQTTTNNTLAEMKGQLATLIIAAEQQAEAERQRIAAEQAAAEAARKQAELAAAQAEAARKAAEAALAGSSSTTTSGSVSGGGSSSGSSKPSTTTPSTPKPSSPQGDGKVQVGDKVTFVSGSYYYDSYGSKPTGAYYKGKQVYITKINNNGSKPYHISTGNRLGVGDLGWLTKSQISGYMSGAKEIKHNELAWTNEFHDKLGGETIVRKSDHAVLSTLSKGSRVYNALASDNIWAMANNPGSFIMDNLLGKGLIGATPNIGSGNNEIEQNVDLDINIQNVEDLNDLLTQMQKSKDFEKLIQAIAVAPLTGTSVNRKNRFNF